MHKYHLLWLIEYQGHGLIPSLWMSLLFFILTSLDFTLQTAFSTFSPALSLFSAHSLPLIMYSECLRSLIKTALPPLLQWIESVGV